VPELNVTLLRIAKPPHYKTLPYLNRAGDCFTAPYPNTAPLCLAPPYFAVAKPRVTLPWRNVTSHYRCRAKPYLAPTLQYPTQPRQHGTGPCQTRAVPSPAVPCRHSALLCHILPLREGALSRCTLPILRVTCPTLPPLNNTAPQHRRTTPRHRGTQLCITVARRFAILYLNHAKPDVTPHCETGTVLCFASTELNLTRLRIAKPTRNATPHCLSLAQPCNAVAVPDRSKRNSTLPEHCPTSLCNAHAMPHAALALRCSTIPEPCSALHCQDRAAQYQ
jgi:hypothetical protein